MGSAVSGHHTKKNFVTVSNSDVVKSGMPLFKRKGSKDLKKLLQDKLRIKEGASQDVDIKNQAEEKPDSVFDLTECGVKKIPDGVFAKCKIFQKQALLLQHNLLEDFKSGGDLTDLGELLILDISYNCLSTLPKAISKLKKLQNLNVSHNKLKKLPEEIGELRDIQVLNLSHNVLSSLPSSVKHFRKIESLDISNNQYLTNLPANLCYMSRLTDFKFDADKITYPVKEITQKGVKEIIRWFKKLKGDEFINEIDDIDGALEVHVASPTKSVSSIGDEDFEESIRERERQREKETQDRLQLEQQILDSQSENAILLANAHKQRNEVLTAIERNQQEAQSKLVKQFDTSNQERSKLLAQLYLEENHLDETVQFVLQMSERAKRTEELMEELEQEQSRIDTLVKITQEESERLRKQEMIEAMTYVLNEMKQSEMRWNEYEHQREESWKRSTKSTNVDNAGLERVLHQKQKDQENLVQQIATEEEKQKAAYQFMQFQKDAKLNRIKKQVDMIEAELARLSMLEIQKQKEKNEHELNSLAEMRVQTAMLLSQLIDEQERREHRLKETVVQMEQQREDDTKDYWLIQFQRLIENKPQVLLDEENRLDVFVVDTLLHAHAKEYLPHFARHHVDETKMRSLTRQDLIEIGVKDGKMQEEILAAIKSSVLMSEQVEKREATFVNPAKPTTPSSSTNQNPLPPIFTPATAPSVSVAGEAECVVCMDNRPEVVFLTCGHVCTCAVCCQPLTECPLCRKEIIQKCRLFGV